MPALPTGFLALPAPPSNGRGKLRSLTRKLRLLALQHLLEAHRESPLGARLTRARHMLTAVARGPHGKALLEAVGAIDVLAPVLADRSGVAPNALASAVPHLFAAMAKRGIPLSDTVLWDLPVHTVPHAGGLLRFDPPAEGVVLDPMGLEVQLAGADGSKRQLPLSAHATELPITEMKPAGRSLPLAGGAHLATFDTNPLADLEEHPDKAGNAVDLGGHTPQTWKRRLDEALHLIDVGLPALHAEMTSTLQRVVPVGFHEEKHLSASYREAPGLIYMSLHPATLTLAEALIHETQHGKLNTLSWFDPILHNAQSTWTESPVRPDPRPLMGVLLAAHAFVPVAALHVSLRAQHHDAVVGAEARLDEVIESNERCLKVLDELARPTPLGGRVVADLQALHEATKQLRENH